MIMPVCTPLSRPDNTKSVSCTRHESAKKFALQPD